MQNQKNKFIEFKSPLFAVCLLLFSFSMYALYSPGFSRHPSMFFSTVVVCGIFDTLFYFFRTKILKFPLSGIVSGFGLFFLFDSPRIELYLLLAFFTILAKNYLTLNGKHIYNPTNLSLLIFAFAFSDLATINSIRWGGRIEFSIIFIFFGLAITYWANRIAMSLTFIITFILAAYFKVLFLKAKMHILLLPLLGPALQLYLFFMITDPATTPKSRKEQIVFAFLVAVVDSYFRFLQNRYAQLLSLVIITSCFAFYNYYKNQTSK